MPFITSESSISRYSIQYSIPHIIVRCVEKLQTNLITAVTIFQFHSILNFYLSLNYSSHSIATIVWFGFDQKILVSQGN